LKALINSSNQVFKQGTWEALTTLGSDADHLVWAPFLLTEIAFALLRLRSVSNYLRQFLQLV
jgi:hypothetical protein